MEPLTICSRLKGHTHLRLEEVSIDDMLVSSLPSNFTARLSSAFLKVNSC